MDFVSCPRRALALGIAVPLLLAAIAHDLSAQELVVSASHAYYLGINGDPVVVIADLAGTLPEPPLIYIAPPALGTDLWTKPHGLTLFSANLALASRIVNYGGTGGGLIDIIDTALGTRVDDFSMAGYENDGLGTLAADPTKSYLLVFSGLSNSALYVVPAPFSATSTATAVAMPSNGGTAQTRAIAFDSVTGRAYVGHVTGISALDPPYTSIVYTIPLPPSQGATRGRAVALSADNTILASTVYGDAKVEVLNAPFSAASVATEINVPNAGTLDGLAFTPDGSQLLVVDDVMPPNNTDTVKAYAISSPFDTNAVIEPLDTGETMEGFEDIDISADGEFAALSGGDELGHPLYILRAPFTTATVQAQAITIPPLLGEYGEFGGRGTGSARFWTAPLDAIPQIVPDLFVSITEGDSGTEPMPIHVRLSVPSAQTVTIDYATMDGNLTAPNRYIATAGTLTFLPAQTTQTIFVPIVGNTVQDGSGNFYVTFSNPVNASLIGTGSLVPCYVYDNDANAFIITNPSPLPEGFVGSPYSLTFTAEGGPGGYVNWGYFNSNLPGGLSIDLNSGVLSGVPTTVGTSLFTVYVSSANGSASAFQTYQLTIGSDRIFADGFDPR